ncbi:SseB family protein [Nocardioides perillae]|uniref:SseB protein N-terminal domain-containing protein n=1 Tax=Nocardioides perillae TaxID=1119534 RepID=A0A7Y9RTH2_9ACTN|nr:hypothetical protein [Nocardioides perillae]
MSAPQDRFAGRAIPDPGFAGDRGEVAPEVRDALARHAAGEAGAAATLAVLQHARVLVPVVAVADEVEVDEHGLAHDKSSDMAAVLMRGRDGRLALLAFTGTAALQAWDPAARPVPVSLRDAARAALQDDAAAVVLDVAGPATYVVQGADLEALAAGLLLAFAGDRAVWVAPDDSRPGDEVG